MPELCRFSIHQNWKDVDLSPIKITSNKLHLNNVDFLLIDITSNKVRWNDVDFPLIKITSKKYVETTWIFHPSKLHRENTSKRCGNLSIFSFRRIHVISTSNRRRFDVLCPLGKWNILRRLYFLYISLFCSRSNFNIF